MRKPEEHFPKPKTAVEDFHMKPGETAKHKT